MSKQVSRGSAGEYLSDERAGVARLRWRVSWLIRLLSLDPELGLRKTLPAKEDFSSPALGHIYAVLLERIEKHESVNSANLGEALSSGEMSLLVRIQQAPVSMTRGEQALGDYISIIRQQAEQRRRKDQPLDFEAIKQSKRETGKRYENG